MMIVSFVNILWANSAIFFFHDFEYFAIHSTSYSLFVLFEVYAYVGINYCPCIIVVSRSQWPRGLRCSSESARLLRLRVRILPGAWMSVSKECCMLSGRGPCFEMIIRPEECYRVWCVVVCDLETS